LNNALNGIRILDLTRLNPGAYCTMLLADMGADVLKIEQPGRGDYLRYTPPLIGTQSSMFLTLNRNKKSMTLNLKSEEGKEIFTRLLDSYDILVESFRPGVCKRLGVDYETLKKDHPELIYCPITGFGQDGPYKNLVGHDINYLALSGILSLTGEKNGPPIVPGIPIADIAGSMFGIMGILLAVISRQKNGRGQFVDISMFDGVVSWLTIQAARFIADGKSPERETWPAGGEPFYSVYQTKDGKYVAVGAAEDKFWKILCEKIGAKDLLEDRTAKDQRKKEVINRLSDIFRTKNRDEWFKIFYDLDSCLTPVKTLDEVFSDPHVKHRELIFDLDCPGSGNVKQLALPVKFSEIKPEIKMPPPSLGQHTDSILNELGYENNEIAQLKMKDVI
jgi:crotonobetainyl-CoA:carnitine CoA-transferase CaiB-like acyl-CoA transferase